MMRMAKQPNHRPSCTVTSQTPPTQSSLALFTWDVHFSRGRFHLVAGPEQRATPFSAAACSKQASVRALAPPNLGTYVSLRWLVPGSGLGFAVRFSSWPTNQEKRTTFRQSFFLGCGTRTRTWDLMVMSHASCRCSIPRHQNYSLE